MALFTDQIDQGDGPAANFGLRLGEIIQGGFGGRVRYAISMQRSKSFGSVIGEESGVHKLTATEYTLPSAEGSKKKYAGRRPTPTRKETFTQKG